MNKWLRRLIMGKAPNVFDGNIAKLHEASNCFSKEIEQIKAKQLKLRSIKDLLCKRVIQELYQKGYDHEYLKRNDLNLEEVLNLEILITDKVTFERYQSYKKLKEKYNKEEDLLFNQMKSADVSLRLWPSCSEGPWK